jgi:hypothetical protein
MSAHERTMKSMVPWHSSVAPLAVRRGRVTSALRHVPDKWHA